MLIIWHLNVTVTDINLFLLDEHLNESQFIKELINNSIDVRKT